MGDDEDLLHRVLEAGVGNAEALEQAPDAIDLLFVERVKGWARHKRRNGNGSRHIS